MESSPEFLGPAGAREGDAVRRRPARRRARRAARGRTTGSTGSGSARAATSATSAARRASTRATRSRSSAPSRSSRGDRPRHGRASTRSGSSSRRRRPASCARPSSSRRPGHRRGDRAVKFAIRLARAGKVPPFPPHVRRTSASRGSRTAGRRSRGCAGIVQGEAALAKLARRHEASATLRAVSVPTATNGGGRPMKRARVLQGLPAPACRRRSSTPRPRRCAEKVGLELVDSSRLTCCGAGDIHEAEPDYYLHLNARILASGRAARAATRS